MSMMVRHEIYTTLGFKVCKYHFWDLWKDLYYWEPNIINNKDSKPVNIYVPEAHWPTEKVANPQNEICVPNSRYTNAGLISSAGSGPNRPDYCKAYECKEDRLEEFPFLDLNIPRDCEKAKAATKGNIVELTPLIMLTLIIFLLSKFNEIAMSLGESIFGSFGGGSAQSINSSKQFSSFAAKTRASISKFSKSNNFVTNNFVTRALFNNRAARIIRRGSQNIRKVVTVGNEYVLSGKILAPSTIGYLPKKLGAKIVKSVAIPIVAGSKIVKSVAGSKIVKSVATPKSKGGKAALFIGKAGLFILTSPISLPILAVSTYNNVSKSLKTNITATSYKYKNTLIGSIWNEFYKPNYEFLNNAMLEKKYNLNEKLKSTLDEKLMNGLPNNLKKEELLENLLKSNSLKERERLQKTINKAYIKQNKKLTKDEKEAIKLEILRKNMHTTLFGENYENAKDFTKNTLLIKEKKEKEQLLDLKLNIDNLAKGLKENEAKLTSLKKGNNRLSDEDLANPNKKSEVISSLEKKCEEKNLINLHINIEEKRKKLESNKQELETLKPNTKLEFLTKLFKPKPTAEELKEKEEKINKLEKSIKQDSTNLEIEQKKYDNSKNKAMKTAIKSFVKKDEVNDKLNKLNSEIQDLTDKSDQYKLPEMIKENSNKKQNLEEDYTKNQNIKLKETVESIHNQGNIEKELALLKANIFDLEENKKKIETTSVLVDFIEKNNKAMQSTIKLLAMLKEVKENKKKEEDKKKDKDVKK
jgi:hypothetical protein